MQTRYPTKEPFEQENGIDLSTRIKDLETVKVQEAARKRKRGALCDISNTLDTISSRSKAADVSLHRYVNKRPLIEKGNIGAGKRTRSSTFVANRRIDPIVSKRRRQQDGEGQRKQTSLLEFKTHTWTSTPSTLIDSNVRVSLKYTARPYIFKFDATNSGFCPEAYASCIRDIDAPHENSPSYCTKVVRELDVYHRKHEEKYMARPYYIGTVQTDINEKMRTILVDWLVEVGEEYDLDSQTFHKAVNLVDRCLSKFRISRKEFQLLGCACMMIAAKFEEVYGPNVDEFVYISDQTYTCDQMLEMESRVLAALEFRIASTTCFHFLCRASRAGCEQPRQHALAFYLCDFAMLYYTMLQYRPSQIACAAVYLARLMTKETLGWTPTLHHFSKYSAFHIKDCVCSLHKLHMEEYTVFEKTRDKAKAISEKYASDIFHRVSAIAPIDFVILEKSFEFYQKDS